MKDKRTFNFLEIIFCSLSKHEYFNRLCAWSFFRHDIIVMMASYFSGILTTVGLFLALCSIISFTTAVIIGGIFGGFCLIIIKFRELFLDSLNPTSAVGREIHESMWLLIEHKIRDSGNIGLTTEERDRFISSLNRIKDHFKNNKTKQP